LNLERALARSQAREPRWDYGIGLGAGGKDIVVWLEVHPASSTRNLEEVSSKLDWLRAWVRSSAPALGRLRARFVWLATGRVCFPCHSPHRKRIAQHGLEFCAHHLDLDHYLDPDH